MAAPSLRPSQPPGLVCVTGLPRAGSTLLCQLLADHPEIASDGHSSPLCNTLLAIRRQVSADQFFLSQLDSTNVASQRNLRSKIPEIRQNQNQAEPRLSQIVVRFCPLLSSNPAPESYAIDFATKRAPAMLAPLALRNNVR